jgi:hypothetical protein
LVVKHLADRDAGSWHAPGSRASLDYKAGESLRIGSFATDLSDIFGGGPALVEVGWSPEAQGLFVNASEGGANGSWGSRVFVTRNGNVVEVPVRKLVIATNGLVPDCPGGEGELCKYLDLGSLAWLDHGRKILMMLSVPNSSGFTDMGKAELFVVDVQTNTVDKVISPAEALRSYSTYLLPWIRRSLANFPNNGRGKHSHD